MSTPCGRAYGVFLVVCSPGCAVCRVWCKVDTQPSQALLAAQEKLLALRQLVQAERRNDGLGIGWQSGKVAEWQSRGESTREWPAHLGWHSEPFSQLLPRKAVSSLQSPVSQSLSTQSSVLTPQSPPTFCLSPDMALALLNQQRVAESRIWFLLRHLDEEGRGWITVEQVRQWVGNGESCWCMCGWRQLRILLGQGEGLFWQRQGERLWLRSVAKVAAALGLTHLSGHPVALPIHILTRPIGEVKAHFYASFHSGRNHDHQPIARTTLSQLSGVSHQTQRQYEKRAGVRPQTNFALGECASPESREERSWKHGTGVFLFTDYRGQHGPAQTTYLAWQLPNDYTGPHDRQSKRQHKRLNRQLADLRLQGTAGNGQFRRTFFADGCAAVQGQKDGEVYWRGRGRKKSGQIWYLLEKPEVY